MIDTRSADEVKLWDLPDVEEQSSQDDTQTNALNKPKGKWKFEAPEQEEDLSPLTAKDIEDIRKAAYDDGHSDGKEQGYKDGHAEGLEKGQVEGIELGKETGFAQSKQEADTKAKVHLDALQSILEQFDSPLAMINAEVKNELVLLAVSLAKAVIKTEVSQSSDSLLNVINESIAALPINESTYQIFLNPEDLETLTKRFSDNSKANAWEFAPDHDMQRGGCKIVSRNNAVDMSITRRCEQVFEKLLLEQGLSDDPRLS